MNAVLTIVAMLTALMVLRPDLGRNHALEDFRNGNSQEAARKALAPTPSYRPCDGNVGDVEQAPPNGLSSGL